jgi:hypothetical protein
MRDRDESISSPAERMVIARNLDGIILVIRFLT